MSTFVDALRSGPVLLMDGAMGTQLQKRGLKPDECGEEWNITHPDQVSAIHRSYAGSGAEVLLTNTFQSTAAALTRRGCTCSPKETVEAALNLARVHGRWIVGDIGPFADSSPANEPERQFIWPLSVVAAAIASRDRRAMLSALAALDCSEVVAAMTSCDAILMETLSDFAPVIRALNSVAGMPQRPPFLASATYLRDGNWIRTYSRLTPQQWACEAEKHSGIVAIGVNCGRDIGMKECVEIVHRYRDNTYLPVFVRPNAGTPKSRNEQWVYPHSPEYMASWLPELLEAGVRMIGGCCGTTPAHIAAFKNVIDEWNKTHEAS